MNLEEIGKLIELIRGYSPSFSLASQTPAVWGFALADIPYSVAVSAVHAHYSDAKSWATVADIRRRAAAAAGILPPDPDSGHAQAIALYRWYGPTGSTPTTPRPAVHPAVDATIDVVGIEAAAGMSRFDWRTAYAPHVAAFEQRALAIGGIPAARAEINKAHPPIRPAIEPAAEPADTGRTAELRRRRAANMAQLGKAIDEFGDEARYLLPPGMSLSSRYARTAIEDRLRGYGFDRDPAEAMRRARLEIARNSNSRRAAADEDRRTADLQALEQMIAARTPASVAAVPDGRDDRETEDVP